MKHVLHVEFDDETGETLVVSLPRYNAVRLGLIAWIERLVSLDFLRDAERQHAEAALKANKQV
ncbi:MAG TPA: hypothetical protein VFN53_06535 [Acidobacteriaceae bacterium]|nr:hypothetical protein [Acidobacteriaceae bacterium]